MSPDELIARVAAKQHGAFTPSQARRTGFSVAAIRTRRETGRWSTLHRGVYGFPGAPATWEQRVIAATILFDGVASSITAARLHGILERVEGPIHVTLPTGQKRRKRAGIILHEATLLRTDVRTIDGIRVTAPERTLVDLAAVLTARALEAALDDAVQLGLTTVRKLRRYVTARNLSHLRGMRNLRKLLADRAKGAMQKELERMFRRKLRASGLPEPMRQYPVGRYRIDFAYPSKKIAIELDGLGHLTAQAFRKDKRKDNAIVLAGFALFHFTWEDVDDRWAEVESTLRGALALG